TRYYTCGGSTVGMRVGGTGNGTLTWLTSDVANSTQAAVNPSTGTTTQTRWLPFGAQRGTQALPTGTNRGFLGENGDPSTGLDQLGARYYDPSLGRFLSVDPITTTFIPQNLNAYSYSINNPTTFRDPTGLCPQDLCDGYGNSPGSTPKPSGSPPTSNRDSGCGGQGHSNDRDCPGSPSASGGEPACGGQGHSNDRDCPGESIGTGCMFCD